VSTSPSATDLFDRAAEAGDLGSVVFRGLGGFLLSIAYAVTQGAVTAAEIFLIPGQALASSLGDLVVAFFGEGAAGIVEAGAEATQTSLQGQYSVGPLTFALAIGSVLLGLYVIAQYRDEEDTGNLIPGLPFDVPFIGEEEEDED